MFVASLVLLLALAAPQSVQVERYRFESSPWMNLHQRLLYEAQWNGAAPSRLTVDEKPVWDAAVATYRTLFAKKSPVENEGLIAIDKALWGAAELPPAIPEKVADALRTTMPLYEKAQWRQDDRANRFWISLVQPMLESAAPELIAAAEKAYGVPFPKRIDVDVAPYAWQFGAYTNGDGEAVHVVIGTTDPANHGLGALEAMMHEPSHGIVDVNSGAIGTDLGRLSKELHVRPMANLWHALLFFTVGELTKQALAERGIDDYKPVIERGLYDGPFKGYRESLETHWRAYLDGKESRDEALKQILLATGRPVTH